MDSKTAVGAEGRGMKAAGVPVRSLPRALVDTGGYGILYWPYA